MPALVRPRPLPAEFHTDERCFITEHLNLPESPEASLALARVAAGVTTRLHAVRGTIERYVILKGTGLVEVGGEIAAGRSGDRVLDPRRRAAADHQHRRRPTWNSIASARRAFARRPTSTSRPDTPLFELGDPFRAVCMRCA